MADRATKITIWVLAVALVAALAGVGAVAITALVPLGRRHRGSRRLRAVRRLLRRRGRARPATEDRGAPRRDQSCSYDRLAAFGDRDPR